MTLVAHDASPLSQGHRPRRPWAAALLTLLLAGLGHLYAGRPRRALIFFVLDALWAILTVQILLRLQTQGPDLYISAGLYWAFRFFVAVDSARTARALASTYTPRRFNRWYFYLVCFLLLGWGHLWTVFHAGIEMFWLPTRAMVPTLIPGDYLLVDRLAYGLPLPLTAGEVLSYAEPERGHLVVYRITDQGIPQNFVFRVVGLPGDELQIRAGQLVLNGVPLDEPYLNREDSPPEDFGPVNVPNGSFFVLGDSRSRSRDSRYTDPQFVPRPQILGRARVILFSEDPHTGNPRWERCGKVIR
jgi:signal peptidase I